MVDRLQQKDAIQNKMYFLMVQAKNENLLFTSEFFVINVHKYNKHIEDMLYLIIMEKTLEIDTKI